MEEIPSLSALESCGDKGLPGEIRENDLERQADPTATMTCTVWNDLRVATEVELGSQWQIMYPEAQLKMAVGSMDVQPQLSVRLRDDSNVCGTCAVVPGATLQLSNSFGDFGHQARKHFQEEQAAAEEESRLRKQRQAEIDQELNVEVTQAILRKQKCAILSIFLCMCIFLSAMISCTGASFNATELQGVGLAVGLLLLFGCATCGIFGLGAAAGGLDLAKGQVQDSVRANPQLRQYQLVARGDDWTILMGLSCFGFLPCISLGCMVAMTAAIVLDGYGRLLALLWSLVALVMCCGGVFGWMTEEGSWKQRADSALAAAFLFPFVWPYFLLQNCGCMDSFASFLLKPPERLLNAAVHTTHEHTIVFEGNVLPKRETVCSWPGKYATAWDELVAGSRHDDISAAVVFLPEGSKHFGLHDPIPAKPDLQDLHGDCWCTPLYGERKPWGCRWWSKWIANIELAASQECTLVVYYFNSMKGNGKVENFSTAGKEHLRREAILRCKDDFLKSKGFRDALEAGLKHLLKEKGPDSSSPYSREVHRLFLATLSKEDQQFLEASEGLGNSQKAEVAWLERNGYPYIEKEVRELESSSPKAIGQATE